MKITVWTCTLLAMSCGAALSTPSTDFTPYQVIIDRKPFGELLAPVSPRLSPQAIAQEAFVKDLRMCAITEDERGIRVGIVNIASNKNYFFSIGDSEDGITLVDADFEEEKALLRKGAEEYWIFMSGAASAGGSGQEPLVAATGGSPGERRRESYAERLRRRREATRVKAAPDVPPVPPEELEKRIAEFQMNLIRSQGELGPPLPIPLTPEQDEQLVREGVLPPLEEAAGGDEGLQ